MFTIFLIVSPPRGSVLAQVPAASRWELGIPILDADLSPDDRLLAVTTTSLEHPKSGQIADESLSIWDYREQRKIVETRVGTYPVGAQPGTVRFTSDGALLVTADAHSIHVFDGTTLKLLREIQPPLADRFVIREIESSPVSHVAIVSAR